MFEHIACHCFQGKHMIQGFFFPSSSSLNPFTFIIFSRFVNETDPRVNNKIVVSFVFLQCKNNRFIKHYKPVNGC